MDRKDKYSMSDMNEQLFEQLCGAISEGYFNEDTMQHFSYWHLASVLNMTKALGKDGVELYLKLKDQIEKISINKIRKSKKIVVGFIANYATTWIGDTLYRLLEESDRFEPYVFLMSNHNGQSEGLIKQEYEQNLQFFKQRNLRVVETLDVENGRQYTWEEIGIKPSICIWLTSWIDLFKEHFFMLNYSLDVIHLYIPYGFMLAENEKGNFVYSQYDKLIHNLVWKNCEESKIAVEMAEKYAFIGKNNAIFTGYPKMDKFYTKNIEGGIWQNVMKKCGSKNVKKIIYAPHHTLDNREPIHFSTFAENHMEILDLVKKYSSETVWVFKPHPQLKYKAIRAGIFQNIEEWNEYEEMWRNLPNADVMEEGDYHELFRESDAMILDSISFLAEYMYAHKPLLILRGEGQFFNDFGRMLTEIHYSVDKNDTEGMRAFIEKIVLEGVDIKKEEREKFFADNLDYYKKGQSAAENIYGLIEQTFS